MASYKIELPGNSYKVELPDDVLLGGRGSLAQGMVGLWVFDNPTGTIRDETSISGNITIIGSPVVETINGYKGLRLNDTATKQYGILSNADFSSVITDEYTWLAVCTVDAISNDSTLLNQLSTTQDNMRAYFGSQLFTEPVGTGLTSNSLSYTAGALETIVVHANETTGDYTLNTDTEYEGLNDTIAVDSGEDINIGANVNSLGGSYVNLFKGVVHRLALFNRELTNTEKASFIANPSLLNRLATYEVNI